MHGSKLAPLIIAILFLSTLTFADVTIRQRVTFSGQGSEQTRMIKGSRERRETKVTLSGDAGQMADMMPNVATITQCDARRTLQVNDKKKLYTSDPFGDETPAATPAPRSTPVTTRKGGTVTITYAAVDTGERKQMFGMTARHLKVSQSMVSSADSCNGAQTSKMELDGWYADFSADFSCPLDLPDTPPSRPSRPDCRDRIITKRSGTARLGFLLDGTMTMFDAKGNVASSMRTETLEISRSPLNAGLFDVGSDYRLVANSADLYAMPSMSEMMAMAGQQDQPRRSVPSAAPAGRKQVAINPISGAGLDKINQNALLQTVASAVTSRGFAASPASTADIASGRFDYVIGVEIVSAKQSKAGKIGGLFGKVTGNSDAAKAGDSEVEVVVTAYQKDGRTVLGRQPAKQKVAGTPDEAARAAVENALNQIIGKLN